MAWDVIISSFHYIIFITSRSSQFNEVLLPAWQQFLRVGNKSSLLQRALCILFSWFLVGGNGGCCGSCMKSLSCFCSLCLSALALQRIRRCFTALLAFFLASWIVPDRGLAACFHCRKGILLAWQSEDSRWSLTLQGWENGEKMRKWCTCAALSEAPHLVTPCVRAWRG